MKRIWMICIQFNKSTSWKFSIYYPRKQGLHALQTGDITTKSVSSVTLLGITIDSQLNFQEDINNIIKEAYYKLYTLGRL